MKCCISTYIRFNKSHRDKHSWWAERIGSLRRQGWRQARNLSFCHTDIHAYIHWHTWFWWFLSQLPLPYLMLCTKAEQPLYRKRDSILQCFEYRYPVFLVVCFYNVSQNMYIAPVNNGKRKKKWECWRCWCLELYLCIQVFMHKMMKTHRPYLCVGI